MTKPSRLPSWLAGSGVIAVAMGVQNLGAYGFTLAAARLLGPREYGATAALMGLLLVLTVVSLGLQVTGARRVSAVPEARDRTEAEIRSAARRTAAGLGALTLLATPLVDSALRLDSWAAGALLAAAVVPLTLMGGYSGILQGERRWLPLAGVYAALGLARLGCGVLGVLWRPDVVGATAGVAVGNLVPAALGWWLLRSPRTRRDPASPTSTGVPVLRELARNSHVLLAFYALSNADVIVARVALDDHDAGLYAGGLILAKAVLFLPQFVVVVAFPSMAGEEQDRRHGRALALVLAIGSAATAGAWLLAPAAVTFVGGAEYADLEPLMWAFAGVGTLLALLQLVVYAAVARQHHRAVGLLWAAVGAVVAVGLVAGSVGSLVAAVALVQTAALVALLALSELRRASSARSPRTRPAAP